MTAQADTGSGRGRPRSALALLALVLTREEGRSANGQSFLTATEGPSFEANFAGFAATPAGARLVQARPDVDALLKDRPRLAACPPGSFGRAYADFLTENGFDEEAYMAGAREAAARLSHDPPRAWYRLRTEAAHDVRHVLSGYGPEVLAEACVLTLRGAQLKHGGALVLALIAGLGAKLREGGAVLPPLLEAWRRGRASRCLDHAPFELDPAAPLSELQAGLGLQPPVRYLAWRRARKARVSAAEAHVARAVG